MELTQDKIDLIERIIKNDKKYLNNEDLYDDFFNETCKRSFLIVKTVTSDTTLEAYLRKIATTSILNVLKDSGRLRRTREGFKSLSRDSIDDDAFSNHFAEVKIAYKDIDAEESPEDLVLKKEILQQVIDSVCYIDSVEPEKNYLQLYKFRYDKGMTQSEIAEELNLSQSEVSKRLFKLMDKVKENFN